ncbi:MAG: hypothetical protein WD851_08325 [Pirellulales bacterium]
MTSASAPSSSPAAPHRRHYQLGVNSYDRASSMLVSLLIMVGVTVGGLLIIYFARQLMLSQVAIPVQPVSLGGRPPDAALGIARDIEPPGLEDAPDLNEPQLQDTLNTLTESLNSSAALLSDEMIDNAAEAGRGSGLGDSRAVGAGGDGDYSRDPVREVKYKPATLAEYAEYLDYFKFELGVFGGQDDNVYYAYNLGKRQPDVRTAKPPDNRLLFLSAGTPLEGLDRQLVGKAGIGGRGRYVAQFCSPETEQILLGLEQQRAGERTREQIKRTVFRVTREGSEFQFSIEEQTYL